MAESPKFLDKIQELHLSGRAPLGKLVLMPEGCEGAARTPRPRLFHPENQIEPKASRGL